MRAYNKVFVQLDFSGTDTRGQAKVSLEDDAYERQLERAHLLCNVYTMLAITFGIGN